jgi:hypothetical protein
VHLSQQQQQQVWEAACCLLALQKNLRTEPPWEGEVLQPLVLEVERPSFGSVGHEEQVHVPRELLLHEEEQDDGVQQYHLQYRPPHGDDAPLQLHHMLHGHDAPHLMA